VVNSRRGMNYPLMNMHERSLSVLGCKVSDCILLCIIVLFVEMDYLFVYCMHLNALLLFKYVCGLCEILMANCYL
jgi:hypothetical protein